MSETTLKPGVVTGDGYKTLLWLSGPWNTYRDYYSKVKGMILEIPE